MTVITTATVTLITTREGRVVVVWVGMVVVLVGGGGGCSHSVSHALMRLRTLTRRSQLAGAGVANLTHSITTSREGRSG